MPTFPSENARWRADRAPLLALLRPPDAKHMELASPDRAATLPIERIESLRRCAVGHLAAGQVEEARGA